MIVEKLSLYDVFTEALSHTKDSDASIVVPYDMITDLLRMCVTNCVGEEYRYNVIQIDGENKSDYILSFVDLDDGIHIFIEPDYNIWKECYFTNECTNLYVNIDCDSDVFEHTKAEKIHIFSVDGQVDY